MANSDDSGKTFTLPENVHVIDNPLVTNRLTVLRMTKTGNRKFREIVKEIAVLSRMKSGRP